MRHKIRNDTAFCHIMMLRGYRYKFMKRRLVGAMNCPMVSIVKSDYWLKAYTRKIKGWRV